MAGRKKRRAFQPRFFIFLVVSALLLVGVVLLASAVTQTIRDNKAKESLNLPTTTALIGDDGATADPNATKAALSDSVIATPKPLPEGGSYTVVADASAQSSLTGFTSEVRINNEEKIYSSYSRSSNLSFTTASKYSTVAGVTTFGSNNYRSSFSYGTATVTMQKLTNKWAMSIGSLGELSGIGWTGQPLIVQWSEEVRKTLGISDAYKQSDGFTEVIYPAADGNIYFYELSTGSSTRSPINIGASLLGTATLDPNGYPLLYVGQGVMSKNSKGTDVAYVYAVDLIKNEVVSTFGGRDYFARRSDWNAFDSSPLIVNDTLIMPAESGVLYTIRLNTKFDAAAGTVSIDPGDRVKFRYSGSDYVSSSVAGKRWYGFEASAVGFRNYLYLTDNGGRLLCLDLNSLTLQFVADLTSDTDASLVLEEDGDANTVYLYTANQTQQHDASLPDGWGYCTVRKLDGLSGRTLWTQTQVCYVGDGSYKSGCKATPHVGKGVVGNLLIVAYYGAGIEKTDEAGNVSYVYGGRIVAYDRSNGSVQWSIEQEGSGDYVSSPLVVYTDAGDAYLIACDRSGFIKLYNAARGTLLDSYQAGSRIDGTPAAFGNYFVVGTTGSTPKIVGMQIN